MDQRRASPEQRIERRSGIGSVILPFLGTREDDFTPFQYLLADLSMNGARILLPYWTSRRELLRTNDTVDFHAPFRFGGETYTSGRIVWARWEREGPTQICGVYFDRQMPSPYPVAISFEQQELDVDLTEFSTSENLLAQVLKDAILLKRGLKIYLKHLVPYLSRVSGVDREKYRFLRAFLFDEAITRIERNQRSLSAVQEALQQSTGRQDVLARLDVEDLLESFEPEIPADIFLLAFDDPAVLPYLQSIKLLEKKLYTSYNSIIMLYLNGFSTMRFGT